MKYTNKHIKEQYKFQFAKLKIASYCLDWTSISNLGNLCMCMCMFSIEKVTSSY